MLYIFLVQLNLDVISHRSLNESPSSFLSVLHFFFKSVFAFPCRLVPSICSSFYLLFCFGCIFSALQTTISSSRCLVFGIFSNTLFLLHYAFQHHLFFIALCQCAQQAGSKTTLRSLTNGQVSSELARQSVEV